MSSVPEEEIESLSEITGDSTETILTQTLLTSNVIAPQWWAGADKGTGAMKEQRLAAITERVVHERTVSAAALAEEFGVSLMTIHRDLDELAREGFLRRFHGGAAAVRDPLFEPDVGLRFRLARAAKRDIAAAAVALLPPNSSILLDDSTSAYGVAQLLPEEGTFTVATSFLPAFDLLAARENVNLIGLGGEFYPKKNSFNGTGLLSALENVRVDFFFGSSAAVDAGGVYHQEPEVITIKRSMMDRASTRVLLVDHSKIGTHAIHRISTLQAWDVIVTDEGISPEHVEQIAAVARKIIVAPPAPDGDS